LPKKASQRERKVGEFEIWVAGIHRGRRYRAAICREPHDGIAHAQFVAGERQQLVSAERTQAEERAQYQQIATRRTTRRAGLESSSALGRSSNTRCQQSMTVTIDSTNEVTVM
jgi:hypothetical protein